MPHGMGPGDLGTLLSINIGTSPLNGRLDPLDLKWETLSVIGGR